MALASFVHLAALSVWLGALVAAMVVSGAVEEEDGFTRASVYRILGSVHTAIIAPAAFVTVLSGLLLTVGMLTQGDGSSSHGTGIVVMEATGLLAGMVGLMVVLPISTRTARQAVPDEKGNLPESIASLTRRQWVASSITLALILVSYFFGVVVD